MEIFIALLVNNYEYGSSPCCHIASPKSCYNLQCYQYYTSMSILLQIRYVEYCCFYTFLRISILKWGLKLVFICISLNISRQMPFCTCTIYNYSCVKCLFILWLNSEWVSYIMAFLRREKSNRGLLFWHPGCQNGTYYVIHRVNNSFWNLPKKAQPFQNLKCKSLLLPRTTKWEKWFFNTLGCAWLNSGNDIISHCSWKRVGRQPGLQ